MVSGPNAPTKFSRVSTVKAKTQKHLNVSLDSLVSLGYFDILILILLLIIVEVS